MTLAICIRCGHEKLGALTPCPSCNFLPESSEDRAKSITLSDHNCDAEALRQISDRIRSGEPFQFDNDAIAQMAVELIALDDLKMPLGCRAAIWTPIVVMFVLIVVLIGLYLYIKAV